MDTLNDLFRPIQMLPGHSTERLVLSLLIAFIIGQFNAWCYKWTYRGVSYSRTFTHALILIAIVSALSMSLVASNALVAVGLLGGLAIIRFRTVVRDARDTSYVFLCLICGMAAGFGFHGTAIIGAIVANLVAGYLHLTSFGAWHSADGLLRFQIKVSALDGQVFESLLTRFCRRFSVISVDESRRPGAEGEAVCQCAYKVRLRDPERGPDLVAALKSALDVEAVHLLIDQEQEEVA